MESPNFALACQTFCVALGRRQKTVAERCHWPGLETSPVVVSSVPPLLPRGARAGTSQQGMHAWISRWTPLPQNDPGEKGQRGHTQMQREGCFLAACQGSSLSLQPRSKGPSSLQSPPRTVRPTSAWHRGPES